MKNVAAKVQTLHLPPPIQKDLTAFCHQLFDLYGDDLVSLTVIGSAAGPTYHEKTSDLNLLVVYSDLNLADLTAVAGLARKWLRKRRFAPRFLSRRNLLSSAAVFPLDTLDMQERHVVLFGEELLPQCVIDRRALAWQVSSELKAMRLRVKQQYWRSAGAPATMAVLIGQRFASLLLLARGVLILDAPGIDPGADPHQIQEALVQRCGLRAQVLEGLAAIQNRTARLTREKGLAAFTDLMEVIRVLDDKAEGLRG